MSEMQLDLGTIAVGTTIQSVKVDPRLRVRISTGVKFYDFILSGEVQQRGLTPSEVILMTGSAGAGKTTLLQMLASSLAEQGNTVLVIGNEESAAQMRMTYERLGLRGNFTIGSCYFMDLTGKKEIDEQLLPDKKKKETHNKTFMGHYEAALAAHKAANEARKKKGEPEKNMVVFVDSLQTLNCGKWGWNTNSKTPERVLAQICKLAKRDFVSVVVVGQVTKGDQFAGKNVLKHMVDGMIELTLDQDVKSPTFGCRLLEMTKHRFGPSGLCVVLDMKPKGLVEHGSMSMGEG